MAEQVAESSPPRDPFLFPGIELNGELGVLASGFGGLVGDFPGSGAGLDARLAYAKLDIPTGPRHRWEVSAQLMESILSSWAGSAAFVLDRQSGNQTVAGVSYGNHLYGDLVEYRPPEAALGNRPTAEHSVEWFGSVFGNHRFQVGPATVDAGMTYHHFSYLDEAGLRRASGRGFLGSDRRWPNRIEGAGRLPGLGAGQRGPESAGENGERGFHRNRDDPERACVPKRPCARKSPSSSGSEKTPSWSFASSKKRRLLSS